MTIKWRLPYLWIPNENTFEAQLRIPKLNRTSFEMEQRLESEIEFIELKSQINVILHIAFSKKSNPGKMGYSTSELICTSNNTFAIGTNWVMLNLSKESMRH